MNNILLLYESVSGSTKEIAESIHAILKNNDLNITITSLRDVRDLSRYDVIILGGPSRFGGFIKKLNAFIKTNSPALQTKRILFFQTCLYIIQSKEDVLPDVSFYVDPSLKMAVTSNREMDMMDKKHKISFYLRLLLNISPSVKPVEIAFFNGALDLSKLNLFERIFMKIITLCTSRQKVGYFINKNAPIEWCDKILPLLRND